ncbi:MAG: hypothetical protein ACJ71E_13195 [Nitrososphaeraceae archaeon]
MVKSPDSAGKAVVVYNSRIAQGKQIFENDGLKLLSLAAGEKDCNTARNLGFSL